MDIDPGIQIGRIDTMMGQRGWGPRESAERSGVA